MSTGLPSIDVVIAAHDPRRRLDRAVASVLDTAAPVRAIVVAHGRPAADFRAVLGRAVADPRLELVEFSDGIRSPAGPFQHGLAAATADYVSIMGSDDFLEAGAMDAWAAHVREHASDYLIARLRDQNGSVWRDPLTRPGRRLRLDPVSDRLDYRAAPLGLIRRSYLTGVGAVLTPGLATGEDIDLGLALLNRGGTIDFGADLPAYVIGGDAPERVTLEGRALSDELQALLLLRSASWLPGLDARRRRAVAIKLWRMNVVPAMLARPDHPQWSREDLDALAAVAHWLGELSPAAVRSLSRTEAALADAALSADAAVIAAADSAARSATRSARLLTRSPLHVLDRDSLLRRVIRLRLPG